MLRTTITCVADAATVDRAGKINILGEFNHIFSKSKPVRWHRLVYVARLEVENADPGEFAFELRILNEDEQPVAPPVTGQWKRRKMAPAGETTTVPILLEVGNAVFQDFGTYSFVLRAAEREVGRTYLYVRPTPAPAA